MLNKFLDSCGLRRTIHLTGRVIFPKERVNEDYRKEPETELNRTNR
jgi:hypothetical protein